MLQRCVSGEREYERNRTARRMERLVLCSTELTPGAHCAGTIHNCHDIVGCLYRDIFIKIAKNGLNMEGALSLCVFTNVVYICCVSLCVYTVFLYLIGWGDSTADEGTCWLWTKEWWRNGCQNLRYGFLLWAACHSIPHLSSLSSSEVLWSQRITCSNSRLSFFRFVTSIEAEARRGCNNRHYRWDFPLWTHEDQHVNPSHWKWPLSSHIDASIAASLCKLLSQCSPS